MLIKAEQTYLRISPRKVRLLVNAIKSLSPLEAIETLKFINKSSSKPLTKVIKQAISNAKNNLKLKDNNLQFNKIEVGAGPINKRWQAVSRGRAHSIFKRSCHIKVILEAKNGTKS